MKLKLKHTHDKKTAIATSAAVTLFLASTGLAVALAGVFDGEPAGREATVAATSKRDGTPTTVVETRYVDDPYYVEGAQAGGAEAPVTGADPTAPGTAATPAGTPSAAGWSALPGAPMSSSAAGGSAAAPAPAASGAAGSSGASGSPPAAAPSGATPTTAKPATPTTVRPPNTTPGPTTTLPAGARIPSDWPPGKPIPPVPPGCVKPVLEDNGVWNCEH